MTIHDISSLDDPRLEVYHGLPTSSVARDSGRFVVEGRLLVGRLLLSEFEVESILIDRQRLNLLPPTPSEIPVYTLDINSLRKIVGFRFHRGLLACGRRRPESKRADVLPAADRPALLVICVDVCDPANLGGIVRNAAAFGADAVLLNDHCADPFSRRVLRASMGATLRLPIVEITDVEQDLRALQDCGVELVAAVVGDNAESLHNADRSFRLGLVIGNEGKGLDPHVVDCCDRKLTIPMQLDTDSLNAAVASGVFLHHFAHVARRQDSDDEQEAMGEPPDSCGKRFT